MKRKTEYQGLKIRQRNGNIQTKIRKNLQECLNRIFKIYVTPQKIKSMYHGHRRKNNFTMKPQKIVSKTITGNDPNLEKEMPIQVQEVFKAPKRQDKKRTFHVIVL